ncbi:MAG: PEP-CTERM system TPR-repeat protein PrsT, partial [Motiliproteus sp.]|nr:PEP-CTERM system TPR-repeat protein PrsT [Motiliproteus sp.]
MDASFFRYLLCLFLLMPIFTSANQSGSLAQIPSVERDRTDTIERLKELVRKNPTSAKKRINLAKFYYLAEQYEYAEKETIKARSFGMDDYFTKTLLVRSQIGLKKFHLAEKLLKDIDAVTSEQRSDKNYLLGYLEEVKKKHTLALKYYKSSIEHFSHSRSLLGISRVLFLKGEYDKSLENLKTLDDVLGKDTPRVELGLVVSSSPHLKNSIRSELYLLSAKVFSEKGEYSEAIKYFDQTIGSDRHSIEAKLGKIKSLIILNKYDESRALVNGLILDYGLQPESLFLRSVIFIHDKNYFEAAVDAEQVLLVSPNHSPSIYIAGLSYFMLGNYEQSALKLGKYIQSNKDSDSARIMLAASYLRLGSPQKTLLILKNILNDDFDNPGVLILAGNAYLQLGHIEKGEALIEKVLTIISPSSDLAMQLATNKFISTGDDSSIRDLRRVRDDSSLDTLMVFGYINKGQYDSARDFLNRKNLENPNNIDSLLLAAFVESAEGKYEEALKLYDNILNIDFINKSALIRKAEISLKFGGVEEAERALSTLLKVDPGHELARLKMISLESLKGNHDQAKSMLVKLPQKFPGSYQVVRRVVGSYIKEGLYKEALSEVKRFRRRNPKDIDAVYLEIEVLDALGLKNDAESQLNNLIEKEPDRISHKIFLSQILTGKNEKEKVVSILKSILDTEPKNVPSLMILANIMLEEGEYNQAVQYLNRVTSLVPGNSFVFKLKGDLLWHNKSYGDAIDAYSVAYPRVRDKEVIYRLYNSYERSLGEDQALGFLEKHSKSYPEDINGLILLAGHYLKTKKFDRAVDIYIELLELQPENPVVWNNLASIFLKQGDKRALEYARKAYELAPNQPEIVDTLGWILVLEGDQLEGIELLQKATSAAKNDKLIRYHYAVGLAKLGTKKAKDSARKLLKTLLND